MTVVATQELERLKNESFELVSKVNRLAQEVLALDRFVRSSQHLGDGRDKTVADYIELVLRAGSGAMSIKELRAAFKRQLNQTVQENTLYQTLKRNPDRFVKVDRGVYSLKEK